MAKSIMHDKQDRTCYLCVMLNGDYAARTGLQEHHVVPGTSGRRLSEKYGLKVYLCLQHHTAGETAAHQNIQTQRLLQQKAQEIFERKYSHEKWMDVFGRNFL